MLLIFFLTGAFGFQYQQVEKLTEFFQDHSFNNLTNDLKSIGQQRMTNFKYLVSSFQIPSLNNTCSSLPCEKCVGLHKMLMCTVCCGGESYYEPISLIAAIQQETSSSLMAHTNRMLVKSLQWVGLHPVYQEWRAKRSEPELDVLALINNFNWAHNMDLVQQESLDFSDPEICGYYIKEKGHGRIVGGKTVKTAGRYPWQLSLASGFYGFFYQHRCGAALIGPKWVLTAAHCVENMDMLTTYVMAGFLAVNNRDTAQIKKVDKSFVHPRFVPDLYEQDVALLRLKEPMIYSTIVLPVCLPPPRKDHLGMVAVLTGWGREWNEGPLSKQLKQVNLPVISNPECMSWYAASGSRQLISESTFLCAGYKDGMQDACSGDSGGPLVVFRGDNRAEVIGVVSWGIGCGVRGRPGVYTRISMFTDWIHHIINQNP